MAAIDPTSVEFQIHQVVVAFQTNKAMNIYRKKWFFLGTVSATNNIGTNAKKIIKVNGETGHAANNNNPDKRLNQRD